MNGKYKYLLKNMGLMTISNFGTKILSLLMVPLYTRLLTREEYGTYDLYLTTLFLLTPILSLNIVDAIMRFSIDEKKDKASVFTYGFKHYILACVLCCVIVMVNVCGGFIHIFNLYPLFFLVYFIFSLLNDFMNQFARGLERIADVAIAGILNSAVILILNVLLLAVFHLGLTGFFVANCAAYVLSSSYFVFRLKVWRYIDFGLRNNRLRKEMILYSVPMGLGNIGWWVNNVSDRYIVTWICGVAENGVYSVAYKIPSLLTVFQLIFNQAWQLSAIKEYDEKSSEFYTSIYRIYNCGMVFVCSGLIIFDKLIAKILFANEFYSAWRYAPFLMISVLFGSLVQLFGGILSAGKQSAVYGRTILIGAGLNIILSFVLVYFIGSIGAAIATAVSYMATWAIRFWETNKFIQIYINLRRDILSYGILCLQASLLLIIDNSAIAILIENFLFVVIVVLYMDDVREYGSTMVQRFLG